MTRRLSPHLRRSSTATRDGRLSRARSGIFNIDLSLQRSFKITEGSRVEFRFDAFNATNHTNFLVPGNNFGTSNFGVIGSALEAEDQEFGLKIYY